MKSGRGVAVVDRGYRVCTYSSAVCVKDGGDFFVVFSFCNRRRFFVCWRVACPGREGAHRSMAEAAAEEAQADEYIGIAR